MAAASLLETALKWKPTPPTHLPPRRLRPPPNHNTLLRAQKPKGFAKIEAMSSPPSSNPSFVKKGETFKKPPIAKAADPAYSGGRMSGDLLAPATPPEKSPDTTRTESSGSGLWTAFPVGFRVLSAFWSVIVFGSIVRSELMLWWLFLLPFVAAFCVAGLVFASPILILLRLIRSMWVLSDRRFLAEITSVVKLQVGLLGMGGSVQRDLNRIAEKSDTCTTEGLSHMLKETTLALLRNSEYYVYVYSSVDVKRTLKDVKEGFDQLSIEERGKFKHTLANVHNVKERSTTNQGDTGLSNEYIVATILVAIKGLHELPVMNRSKDLKESLQKLASIASTRIMALEVLWAPQEGNDTMTERELIEDFPLLRPL